MPEDFVPREEQTTSEKAEDLRLWASEAVEQVAHDLKQLSKEIGKDLKASWKRFLG
jgi:hypothetical protein